MEFRKNDPLRTRRDLQAPCMTCSERYQTCHDSCQKYLEWKQARQPSFNETDRGLWDQKTHSLKKAIRRSGKKYT